MIVRKNNCPNFNHRRSNAPVRCCAMCGEVVNETLPVRKCLEGDHAKKRRERNNYCSDCGEQLIQRI